jgi:hypothetical protein
MCLPAMLSSSQLSKGRDLDSLFLYVYQSPSGVLQLIVVAQLINGKLIYIIINGMN